LGVLGLPGTAATPKNSSGVADESADLGAKAGDPVQPTKNSEPTSNPGAIDEGTEVTNPVGEVETKFPNITNKFPQDPLDPQGKIFGEVGLENGKPNLDNGKPIPSGKPVDFVITQDNRLIIGRKHTALSGSSDADVLAAGTLTFKNGSRISQITNLSGHFRPTVAESLRYPELLRNLGFDLNGTKIEVYKFTENRSGYTIYTEKVVDRYLP
jgi:hypothetical protein